jgi:Protein of unknown function (DUF3027)
VRTGLGHSPSILLLRHYDDHGGHRVAGIPHPDACLPPNEEQLLNVNTLRTRASRAGTREIDETCAAAVGLARSAAEEVAGAGQVGEHLGVEAEGDRVVTHSFACLDPAYAGWRWAVTVTRASRSKTVTVSESLLLPGPDSLLAPDWVPWRDRVRPGDVGVGDLLPAHQDDERLVPAAALEGVEGMLDWDDTTPWMPEIEPRLAEGLDDEIAPREAERRRPAGRPQSDLPPSRSRVMSAIGRDETALRWYSGEHGPRSPLAHAAPGPCMTCGFLVRLSGPLGRVFGVCANEYAPDDGRVVSLDHGCGAHSEAATPSGAYGAASPVIDELGYDLVDTPGVSMEETVFESLDHS